MHRLPPTFTRRHALRLGALAGLAAAARPPLPALARSTGPESFSMALALGDGARAARRGGWTVLPVTRAPRRFDLIGLGWERGSSPRAEVRARARHGRWTAWVPLHGGADHGPDGGRRRGGTDPVWTGAADVFQVRVRGPLPQAARALFVRALPAAPAARASRRRQAAAPAQAAGSPPIVARADWGADAYPPRSAPEYGEVLGAFVHHTVTANDYAREESAGIVLGILKYHRDHNGWNDIGYNFLVDRYGQIFEGRAGGIDQAVVGAQAQGYNTFTTGIACLGEHSADALTPECHEALARLIAWKLPVHGQPVTGQYTVTSRGGSENRYAAGTAVTLERISGHRDGDRTACPGDALYGQLPALRERAAALAVPVSSLTMTAASTRIRHPGSVELRGVLRFADGASPSGRTIQVQFQSSGSAWQVLQNAQTDANGVWSAAFPAPASGLLRAVFAGDGTHPPLEAGPVRLHLVPDVTLELASRRSRTGARVPVSGTVGPNWPARVQLTLERRRRGRWVRIQRKRINVRGGDYATYVRPGTRGLHRVTVRTPGRTVRRLLRVSDRAGGTGGASAR